VYNSNGFPPECLPLLSDLTLKHRLYLRSGLNHWNITIVTILVLLEPVKGTSGQEGVQYAQFQMQIHSAVYFSKILFLNLVFDRLLWLFVTKIRSKMMWVHILLTHSTVHATVLTTCNKHIPATRTGEKWGHSCWWHSISCGCWNKSIVNVWLGLLRWGESCPTPPFSLVT